MTGSTKERKELCDCLSDLGSHLLAIASATCPTINMLRFFLKRDLSDPALYSGHIKESRLLKTEYFSRLAKMELVGAVSPARGGE